MLFRIPYALELRGGQLANTDYLKLRGVRFARLIAFFFRFALRLQLCYPVAVVSVARHLTDVFKPRSNCPIYFASNARIPHKLYRKERKWQNDSKCRVIVSLGHLSAQKNPIGLVKALAKMQQKGFENWKLVWIGDGPLKQQTQQLVDELGLSSKVELLGFVPWDDVFAVLSTADLFVLNSVSEGLSRAILEAMACALPVVSTTVGGWAEILPKECVVPPQRDDLLADKLYEVITNPDSMTRMSKRNVEKAKEYSAEVLSNRKIEFYKLLRQLVEKEKN
jgi:glycosyltransferase involved in cell wall biosynthesis